MFRSIVAILVMQRARVQNLWKCSMYVTSDTLLLLNLMQYRAQASFARAELPVWGNYATVHAWDEASTILNQNVLQ